MIKNLLDADTEPMSEDVKHAPEPTASIFSLSEPAPAADPNYDASDWSDAPKTDDWTTPEPRKDEPAIVIAPFKPPSTVEAIRRSGLAWSAGVVFFGSVAFTLILGWFADLLFGSSPWGLVVGIVVGSLIGFVNFFRITSQIFKN